MRIPKQAAAIAFLLLAVPAFAGITIDELISQSRLVEGPVAVQDVPRWNGARKILVTRVGKEYAPKLQALLPDSELVFVSSAEEALSKVRDVDAIIGSCSPELIAVAHRLVWVQIFSSGAEHCLAVPRIASGEVLLTNMQKMSSPTIGEHAVAMALTLARGLPSFARHMPDGEWRRNSETTAHMVPLGGKTMLVIGLGGIGTEAARRGAGLGMRVVGTRNSSRKGPEFVDYVGLSHELAELAGDADVIVNALPLTDSTRGMLDGEFFAAVKKGAFFVNVGRGGTVDTDALLAALQSGHLGGAGLDVTDPEPLPPSHPLWQLDNVIITPHVASRGGERDRHMTLLLENMRRYAAGDALFNVVDPEKGY